MTYYIIQYIAFIQTILQCNFIFIKFINLIYFINTTTFIKLLKIILFLKTLN